MPLAPEEDILDWLTAAADPPYLVLSHGEDLDGLTSAAMLYAALAGEVRLKFDSPDRTLKSKASVHIVADLPPPAGGALIMFDHHETNVALARERVKRAFVSPRSPSTADVIRSVLSDRVDFSRLSSLIELTSKIDSGLMGFEGAAFTAAVKKLFWSPKRGALLESIVRALLESPPASEEALLEIPAVKRSWQEILRLHGQEIRWISQLGSCPELQDPGPTAAVVDMRRVPGYLTPLVHQALRDSVDVVVTLGRWRGEDSRVSVRSRPGGPPIPLSLAKIFGGGGHPRAAGFTLRASDLPRMIELLRKSNLSVVFIKPPSTAR
mgnify:CR=1 FL=1